MSAARQRPAAAGFTLIEVLVAMFIMAVMAVMAWQGVDGIVRSRDISQQRLDQTLRLNTVLAQWEQDLSSVQETNLLPRSLMCDGASVRLTRRTPDGVQVVVWALRPDPAGAEVGGSVWQRWAGPAVTTASALQDSWLASLQLQGTEPGQLRTLSGLDQWQVYFFQGNQWANCQSTGNLAEAVAPPAGGASAPVVTREALPSGVRVVLTFAPGSGLAGTLTRDSLLDP
ncbi:MAG: prepilin-type N-terminal cleavage/methylation domain-containing protein [Burkholderiaceae bacterium]